MKKKVLIFGASGGTGRQLVVQALEQNHMVTALVRNPAAMDKFRTDIAIIKGDILDYETVETAVFGKDIVLSALGTKDLKENTVLSDGTRNILTAMEKFGVKRFICETSLGIGESRYVVGPLFQFVLIPFVMKHIFADKERQETYIMKSKLEWIIVRPGGLTDGPRTGVYRCWVGREGKPGKLMISRADVADFMLKQITDNTYLYKAVGLAY